MTKAMPGHRPVAAPSDGRIRPAWARAFPLLVLVAAIVAGCAATAARPRDDGAGAEAGAAGIVVAATPSPSAASTPSPAPSPGAPSPTPSASPGPTSEPAVTPKPLPGASSSPAAEPLVASGPAWTTRSVALLRKPGDAATATAHVASAFPLELTSRTTAVGPAVWVEARWETPGRRGVAWVPNAAVTRARPTRTPAASVDALDASLYRYLRSLGTRVGVEAWDLTRGIVYTHNSGRQYLVASSIKVELLCWFLATLEKEGREPTRGEKALLTAMIVRSDNDAAEHFYRMLGEAPGLTAYMKRIGVSGLTASPAWRGWGWSTITPAAQVNVLRLLHLGKLLNPKHTAFALGLLGSVIPEHRVGVGTTAPENADVAMKVGWVIGPDGLWVMNSSGIVTYRGVTYVVAIYSDRDATLEEGQEIVEHVADRIATALLDAD